MPDDVFNAEIDKLLTAEPSDTEYHLRKDRGKKLYNERFKQQEVLN